jgi:prepilin-type N-terminal cleavage/methylation domain-containing protein/prepilin-type processing-associated H-X9-DG protein
MVASGWHMEAKRRPGRAGALSGPSLSRRTGCDAAFTLIELLVVLAILSLLAALFLPAVNNAKELGRLARCKANVRQISLAMEMYVSDNGRYPFYLMVLGGPSNFVSWDEALVPYTQSHWTNDLYKCPSYRYSSRPMSYDAASGAWVTPQGSYGYNWIGTGELPRTPGVSVLHLGLGAMALQPGGPVEQSRRESDVLVPSDMVELGDGGGGQISPPSAVSPNYHRFAHRFLLNMTFCDGHAETVQGYPFYEPNPEARKHFNYDDQPHPETWEDEPKNVSAPTSDPDRAPAPTQPPSGPPPPAPGGPDRGPDRRPERTPELEPGSEPKGDLDHDSEAREGIGLTLGRLRISRKDHENPARRR